MFGSGLPACIIPHNVFSNRFGTACTGTVFITALVPLGMLECPMYEAKNDLDSVLGSRGGFFEVTPGVCTYGRNMLEAFSYTTRKHWEAFSEKNSPQQSCTGVIFEKTTDIRPLCCALMGLHKIAFRVHQTLGFSRQKFYSALATDRERFFRHLQMSLGSERRRAPSHIFPISSMLYLKPSFLQSAWKKCSRTALFCM